MALHKMEEVSGMHYGSLPYEECVPTGSELDVFTKEKLSIYSIYWEVCHFFIYMDEGERSHGITYLAWANYLFPAVEGPRVKNLAPVASEQALEIAYQSKEGAPYSSLRMVGSFKLGAFFQSFHHMAVYPSLGMRFACGLFNDMAKAMHGTLSSK